MFYPSQKIVKICFCLCLWLYMFLFVAAAGVSIEQRNILVLNFRDQPKMAEKIRCRQRLPALQ